jgi:hypothetical protein
MIDTHAIRILVNNVDRLMVTVNNSHTTQYEKVHLLRKVNGFQKEIATLRKVG